MAKIASKAMTRASGAKPSIARSSSPSENMSISVRKIDNGYIICRSGDGPKGYNYSETYSATKPKIEVPSLHAASRADARNERSYKKR